jgi:hypothetical protein
MCVMMPGFFRDMPKRGRGRYRASVETTVRYRPGKRRWSRVCHGRQRAYWMARLVALWYDLTTPDFDGQVGISWIVQREG